MAIRGLVWAATLALAPSAYAHLALSNPCMYGFNVTQEMFPYDNRAVAPLMHRTFDQWWWHGHQNYPPHPGDVCKLPAGGSIMLEIACNKGWTSYWKTSEGSTDLRDGSGRACGNGSPYSVHASSQADVTGSGLAIAYKDKFEDVKKEDFVMFSIKTDSPWYTENHFEVPNDMPACDTPSGNCLCAWFWIHASDAGGQQMFMNPFVCKVTDVKSTAKKIGKPQLARRCGADEWGRPDVPWNCTKGPVQPLYWYNEGVTFFEDQYDPPLYNGKYGFKNGAQNQIFIDEGGSTDDGESSTSTTSHTSTHTSTHAAATTTSSTVSTKTSTSSAAAATTSQASSSNNTSSSGNNLAASSGTKQNHCKRRTAAEKLKRRKRAAVAKAHRKRSSSLFS